MPAHALPAPTITPDKRKTLTPDRKTGTEELATASEKSPGHAHIEKQFGDLIPSGLSERERERAINGIAVGLFINRLDPETLRQKIEQARDAVKHDRGLDDDKAARMAVLGFARQARAEAIERDPMAALSGDDQRRYVAAAAYAKRELGWQPQQIREAAVDLIVRFDGDQTKAARAFGEMVLVDRRVEAGHLKDQSATPVIEMERGKPAAEWERRGGMARRDDELTDPDDLTRRAERERKVDSEVARIDKVAACVLGDKEYAAYRLMRDNAEVIHLSRAETTLDGEARDNTAGKLIADRMGMSLRHGRNYAAAVMEKVRAGQDPATRTTWGPKMTFENGELSGDFMQQLAAFSAKTNARLDTPTAQIVAAQRSGKAQEQLEESRNRERMATRERAARLYAAKKERVAAEKAVAPGQTSPVVVPSVTRRQDQQIGL